MGFFNKILSTLGIGDAEAEETKDTDTAPATAAPPAAQAPGDASAPDAPATPPPPVAIPVVDVMAKLEAMAEANPQKLNWKTSIVDLLKLLGLESSYGVRKELAAELDCPAELMGDSAQMNMWLHKTVLRKIAENGGNIPQDLLD
jgi:hypothetical protein